MSHIVQQLYRYRLHHLLFWSMYHYLWWAMSSGDPLGAANNIISSPYSIKFICYVVLQAVGVYFNLYFLIPRFLEKGKYGTYFLTLFATIVCTSILIIGGYFVSAWIFDRSFEELYKVGQSDWIKLLRSSSFPSTVASMTLAMSIKLTKNWLQSQQREQVLAKEKLETELKFLRSQFNPHFLFNTINSIFHLIHKNPDEASESLAKFSDLLRYQLYECNEVQIPLDLEIGYLNNFIGLERLRHENSLEVINHLTNAPKGGLMISPFILMPFIENAFKHVSREESSDNFIEINLSIHESIMTFEVTNTASPAPVQATAAWEAGGLGLKNVRRRLELLYPDQHQLTITTQNQRHHVSLRLELSGQPSHFFAPSLANS